MADEPTNMVLEQLRLIRQDIAEVKGAVEDLKIGHQSMQGIMMAVGHSLHTLDHRVEHIEQKLGIET